MIIVLVIVYSAKHVLTGIEKYNLFDLFLYLEKEDLQLPHVKSQSLFPQAWYLYDQRHRKET